MDHSRKSSCKHWKPVSIERLRALWPQYPKKALLDAFPGRSWAALQNKAERLKLRRHRRFAAKTSPTKSLLMERLRSARIDRNLTAKHLSRMIGKSDRYVCQAERGSMNPNMHTINRWCIALGLRLTVEKATADILTLSRRAVA